MTEPLTVFTSTDLIAAASQALAEGDYRRITSKFREWDTPTARLFEDEYSVVGIVVFDTVTELLASWPDMQGKLVDVISGYIGRQESKSWDGYLVLLSPGLAAAGDNAVEAVRTNTTRLRKLVGTGDDLQALADIRRVLSPLLPVNLERLNVSHGSALDLLPRLLAARGIDQETTKTLVDAFREQSPLLEKLHEMRAKK